MDTAAETPKIVSSALRLITVLAVAFTLGNATWAAWDQDATYDEPFHLSWPQRLFAERNDGRELFRFDSKTPALLPAVALRKVALAAGLRSNQVLRFSTRIPSLVFLGALLLLVAEVARTSDPATWWIGLLLAALDPNLAANASIATTDVPYAVVVLALVLSLAIRQPPWIRAALIGAALGLGFAVKFTTVLLVPVALLALVVHRDDSARQRLAGLLSFAASFCLTVSALYLFVGVMDPLGSVPLQTRALRQFSSALPWLPVPFPRSVITGIDMSMAHDDPAEWASYIFGHEHRGGSWYYFAALWLMKTPVALIIAVLFGLWRALKERRDSMVGTAGALILIHLVYFSFFFATQIGFRFVLQSVALSCALAARGLRGTKPGWLMVAAVLALAERAPYWSDPIAFTNLAVWSKSRAYWYMADSNLDIGQNRQRVHKSAKDLGVPLIMDQATITPGLYVIGTNELTVAGSRHSHRWLIDNDIPAINVGYTSFAFSITPERFDRYLNEARTAPPIEHPETRCPLPLKQFAEGAEVPFESTPRADASQLWVVCVAAEQGADLEFRVTNGRVFFGSVSNQGTCQPDLLRAGQQAWFRVGAGHQSQLCLLSLASRSEPDHKTQGVLKIQGHGASVAFREVPSGAIRVDAHEPGSQR